MPLVKARMGDACKYYTIDKGLAGGAPGAPATYVGMCHIFANSVDASRPASVRTERDHGRYSNYTDVAPVMQISEVVVEKSTAAISVTCQRRRSPTRGHV